MTQAELDVCVIELMMLICEDVEDESEGGTGLWTNVQRDGFDPGSGYLQVDGNMNLRRIAAALAEQGWNPVLCGSETSARSAAPDEKAS